VVADRATLPVAERTLPVLITTVPPALFAANVPKFKTVPAVIEIGTITSAVAVLVALAAIAFAPVAAAIAATQRQAMFFSDKFHETLQIALLMFKGLLMSACGVPQKR
jgi:hypothetical protein